MLAKMYEIQTIPRISELRRSTEHLQNVFAERFMVRFNKKCDCSVVHFRKQMFDQQETHFPNILFLLPDGEERVSNHKTWLFTSGQRVFYKWTMKISMHFERWRNVSPLFSFSFSLFLFIFYSIFFHLQIWPYLSCPCAAASRLPCQACSSRRSSRPAAASRRASPGRSPRASGCRSPRSAARPDSICEIFVRVEIQSKRQRQHVNQIYC